MQINDQTIRHAIGIGHLRVRPELEDIQFQPASLDLRLGGDFFRFTESISAINPEQPFDESHGERLLVGNDEVLFLQPGEFLLGTTIEHVTIPNDWVARVEGRSSLGRIGLIVHSTAGFVDPGFSGQITLEMFNLSRRPIRLRPMMRICQLSFNSMNAPAERPYGHPDLKSKYHGQVGVTPSMGSGESP